MEALTFGEETAFVEWPARFVEVFLAIEVPRQFPGDGGLRGAGESVVHYAAWGLHVVGADVPVFVEAVVVDDGGDDVLLPGLEFGESVDVGVDDGFVVASPRAEIGVAEPDTASVCGAALGGNVECCFFAYVEFREQRDPAQM